MGTIRTKRRAFEAQRECAAHDTQSDSLSPSVSQFYVFDRWQGDTVGSRDYVAIEALDPMNLRSRVVCADGICIENAMVADPH